MNDWQIAEIQKCEKVYAKLRMATDAMARAMDQLDEGTLDGAATSYVLNQVDRARGYVFDARQAFDEFVLSLPQALRDRIGPI